MKLLLVRHAEAYAIGEHGIEREFDRSLTDLGRAQTAALSKHLADRGLYADQVVTSPYVRAVQTAEPIAGVLTPGMPVVENELLRLEEMKPKRLVKSLTTNRLTVLVGHQPDLGRFAGWLLGCGPTTIDFEKGSAALIACGKWIAKGRGELRWLVTPNCISGHTTD